MGKDQYVYELGHVLESGYMWLLKWNFIRMQVNQVDQDLTLERKTILSQDVSMPKQVFCKPFHTYVKVTLNRKTTCIVTEIYTHSNPFWKAINKQAASRYSDMKALILIPKLSPPTIFF